jgi:hypothetical protein
LGFDARELTPTFVQRITIAAAETRSFQRAAIVMKGVCGQLISPKSIERVVHAVGDELAQRRDARARSDEPLAQIPVDPPDLAVVECDGGRMQTREPGHGPGVHRRDTGWRETKNACLIRAQRDLCGSDPQPDPPECFCDPKHVAKIAETEALSVTKRLPADGVEANRKEVPTARKGAAKRLVRTVLSSLASAKEFGRQMKREAKQRRFDEASAKAFLGDGLPWNWSIWREQFPDFVPILDFVHVLTYLFAAAKAVHEQAEDAWNQYLVWMRGCWQGEVDQTLDELRAWQARLGEPSDDCPENDRRQILSTTLNYLTNNRSRLKYPEYRQAGLPVTTAWMESLVKEMNYRVKGTEMFWNDPEGAEAILQVRAAALCDDDRLVDHLRHRSGCAFTRRPKSPSLHAKRFKS